MATRIEVLYYELEARTEALSKGFGAAERRMQQFAGLVSKHPVAALGALAATAALAAVEVTKMAVQFDTAMRKVTVLLPAAGAQLAELKQHVVALSKQTPFDAEALAGALRKVVEVGGPEMREPAEAMARLQLATRGALATNQELAPVIEALDSTMDAFGLSGQHAAAGVMDLLTKAQQAGIPFGDLTEVLRSAGPSAAAAGVSLENVVAMIVALDQVGAPAGQQTRMLRQAFTGLRQDSDGLNTQLDKQLGVTIEKVGGQYMLAGRGARAFAEAQREVAGSSGAAARAAAEAMQGPGARWKILTNTIHGAMLTIGDALAGGVNHWVDYWVAANGGAVAETAEQRLTRLARLLSGHASHEGPLAYQPELEARVRAYVAAGGPKPTPPREVDPAKAAAAAARREAAMSQLQAQLAQLTTATLDNTRVAIDRVVASLTAAHVPTSQWANDVARLRANLLVQGDLANFAEGITTAEKAVDGLVQKEQIGTEEWQRQVQALYELRESTYRYVAGLREGTVTYQQGHAALARIEALQQRMTAAKRGEKADAHEIADSDKERMEALQAQARNIEAAARGALQLAQAFGLVDANVAQALESIAQIAGGVVQVAGGAITPESVLSIGGGIASLIGSLFGGPSPEDRARAEALQRNSDAIVELTRVIGELQLQITGREYAGLSAAAAAGAGAPMGPPVDMAVWDRNTWNAFATELGRVGLTMADARRIAGELGLTLDATRDSILQLGEALRQAELDQFAHTFAGQMELLRREFEAFDITDPIQQLEMLQRHLAKLGDSALGGLGAFDLSTQEGRAAADAFLRDLFTQATSGGLSSEQIGALFGNLTPTEFLDAIAALQAGIHSANGAAGDVTGTGTPSVGIERAVTEVTANRLGALLTTDVYWNQQTAQATQQMAAILEACLMTAGVLPPTYGELDRYQPGGGVVITLAEGAIQITIQGAASVEQGQAAGVAAAEGFIAEVDAQLGRQHRQRSRGQGTTILQ